MSREAAEAMATVSASDDFQIENAAPARTDIVAVHRRIDGFPNECNGKPMHFFVTRFGGTSLRA
jgi:hypothetical protein